MIIDTTLGASVTQAVLNFSSSGTNVVIAGSTGKLTRVLQLFFVVGAASNITFQSEGVGLSGQMNFTGAGSFFMDYLQLPLTCLHSGDDFDIVSSNAVQIGGTIWYIKL